MADQPLSQHLSPEQWNRARTFLLQHARPLEAALFRYWFEQGSASTVVQALERFRNDDGGFGHALEPDLRTAASSVLATTTALQTLQELKLPVEHPLIAGAIAYLLATYTPDLQSWPLVPAASEGAPHAPWWNQAGLVERFGGFALNPRAEVLGYLYAYGGAAAAELCAALTPLLLDGLEAHAGDVPLNDYLCVLRLAEAPGLPDVVRTRLKTWLVHTAPRAVALDSAQWAGHALLPVQAAPTPDALLAGPLSAAVQASLDYVIARQEPDGTWSPGWSWFGAYPDDWPAAEQEWRGVLTLERLRWLQHYGRL